MQAVLELMFSVVGWSRCCFAQISEDVLQLSSGTLRCTAAHIYTGCCTHAMVVQHCCCTHAVILLHCCCCTRALMLLHCCCCTLRAALFFCPAVLKNCNIYTNIYIYIYQYQQMGHIQMNISRVEILYFIIWNMNIIHIIHIFKY